MGRRSVLLVILGPLLAGLAVIVARSVGFPEPVPIPERPERIVSLTLATSEILIDLVPRERIAGLHPIAATSSHSNVRHRLDGIPLVAADPEEILALDADLVLVASYSRRELVEQLHRSGLPVYELTLFHDLDSVLRNVEILGRLVGEPERARQLVRRAREEIAAIRGSIPRRSPPPRVVSLGDIGTVAGEGTSFHSVVMLAGAENLAAKNGIEGFAEVSLEQVLTWDPDVIVVARDPDTGASLEQRILSHPAYAPLRKKRIVEIPNPHFTTVSHYIIEGLRDLVRGIYG